MNKLADMLRMYLPNATDSVDMVTHDDVANYICDIEAELYNSGNARQNLSDLRELTEKGATAVIADRGRIDGLSDTTLMMSAQTLTMIISRVIIGEHARHSNREPASALLAGLTPTTPGMGEISIEPLVSDSPGIGADQINLVGQAMITAE